MSGNFEADLELLLEVQGNLREDLESAEGALDEGFTLEERAKTRLYLEQQMAMLDEPDDPEIVHALAVLDLVDHPVSSIGFEIGIA